MTREQLRDANIMELQIRRDSMSEAIQGLAKLLVEIKSSRFADRLEDPKKKIQSFIHNNKLSV